MKESVPPSSSAASLSPTAVFRPRRSEDWQQFRSIIKKLYRNDQMKLRDVRKYMEEKYNFVASEKQYKDRLAVWGVRKNIKAKEVQFMIRKQKKRATRGKRTAFRVGGQEVDSKRIARFISRYSSLWENEEDNSDNQEAETPSDMSCYTPEPEGNLPATFASENSTTSTHVLSDDQSDGIPDPRRDKEPDDGNGSNINGNGKDPGNHHQSPLSTNVQNDILSLEAAPEQISQEEAQQLGPQDLADYQERMAILGQQLQDELGGCIDPYDDDSVGCLLSGDRPRLF